jgi:hypothetical protein
MTTERELITKLPYGRYVLTYGDDAVCLYRLPGVQPVEQPTNHDAVPPWVMKDVYIGLYKIRMNMRRDDKEGVAKDQALIDDRIAQLLGHNR